MPQYAILKKGYREELPQVADAIFEIVGEDVVTHTSPNPISLPERPSFLYQRYEVYDLKVVDNALPCYMGMIFTIPKDQVRLGKKVHMETTQEELDNFLSGNDDIQRLSRPSQ